MIGRLVMALVVVVAVFLGCLLLGDILVTIKVPVVVTVGSFLKSWGYVIGLIAGLWFFFSGGSIHFPTIGGPKAE